MPKRPRHDALHRRDGRKNNISLIVPTHARLRCGHEVRAHPVASLGSLMFFICPHGCGLKRGRKL